MALVRGPRSLDEGALQEGPLGSGLGRIVPLDFDARLLRPLDHLLEKRDVFFGVGDHQPAAVDQLDIRAQLVVQAEPDLHAGLGEGELVGVVFPNQPDSRHRTPGGLVGDIILLEDHHPPAALGEPVSRGAPGDPRSDDYCIGFGRKSIVHSVTLTARLTPFKTVYSFTKPCSPTHPLNRAISMPFTLSSRGPARYLGLAPSRLSPLPPPIRHPSPHPREGPLTLRPSKGRARGGPPCQSGVLILTPKQAPLPCHPEAPLRI